MDTILIIAPHADDETLGCGGYLSRINKTGGLICYLLVTRQPAWKNVTKMISFYSFNKVIKLNYPPARLDERKMCDIISDFRCVLDRICPSKVLLPYRNDAHSDHRVVFAAAVAALKPFRCVEQVKEIWEYETLSETNQSEIPFDPNVFVSLSQADLDYKLEAMKMFERESILYTRSEREINALAVLRGSRVNLKYAEAYHSVRMVV